MATFKEMPKWFAAQVRTAVLAAPENPRKGLPPGQVLPFSKVKTAAVWCEPLRLPSKDVARLAGRLAGSRLSPSVLAVWRTEVAYRDSYRQVQDEIIRAFQQRYLEVREDQAALDEFAKELLLFGDAIATAVISTSYQGDELQLEMLGEPLEADKEGHWERREVRYLSVPRLPVIKAGMRLALWWWINYSKAPWKAMDRAGLSVGETSANMVNGTIRRWVHAAAILMQKARGAGNWVTAQEAFDLMAWCSLEILGPFTQKEPTGRKARS